MIQRKAVLAVILCVSPTALGPIAGAAETPGREHFKASRDLRDGRSVIEVHPDDDRIVIKETIQRPCYSPGQTARVVTVFSRDMRYDLDVSSMFSISGVFIRNADDDYSFKIKMIDCEGAVWESERDDSVLIITGPVLEDAYQLEDFLSALE